MRALFVLLMVSTALSPTAARADLNSGLIAFYPFSGNARDESANGNHGSVQGPVLTEDRNGQPDSAYRFSGGSDVILVADPAILDVENAVSFTAWIRPEVPSGIYILWREDAVDGGSLFSFDIYPGYIRCGLKRPTGGSASVQGNTAIQQGIWQHVAVTWDGTTMRAYYNGQPDGSSDFAGPMAVSDGDLSIGRYYTGFAGDIDEVRIYDRALSESEINELLGAGYIYWMDNAAHLSGQFGSQWRTDVAARNAGDAPASVQFRLHSRDGIQSHSGSIDPAEQGVFEDLVGLMGYSGKGCLEVRSDQPLLVSGRIFNQADAGTFGQFVQGYAFGQGLAQGETTWLLQLRQQQGVYRTNISVANTGSAPAEVEVRLYDRAGNELTVYTLNLDPSELIQDTEPFSSRANRPNLGWGYAEVTAISGFGVLTSASVVDSVTNDATTVPMTR
jgi:hypothetical protein